MGLSSSARPEEEYLVKVIQENRDKVEFKEYIIYYRSLNKI